MLEEDEALVKERDARESKSALEHADQALQAAAAEAAAKAETAAEVQRAAQLAANDIEKEYDAKHDAAMRLATQAAVEAAVVAARCRAEREIASAVKSLTDTELAKSKARTASMQGLVGKAASQCPPPTPARAEMRAAVHASPAQVPEIPLAEQVAADYRREVERLKHEMESLQAETRALAGTPPVGSAGAAPGAVGGAGPPPPAVSRGAASGAAALFLPPGGAGAPEPVVDLTAPPVMQ